MNSRWRLGARPGLAGRLLTLALLLLALWNPRLPGGEQPLSLTLLLDDSASMPRSLSDETWRQVMSELAADHRPIRVDLVRFGGDRVREFTALDPARDRRWATQPPRLRPLERGESDIGQALRSALVRMESGRPRAILLVSDGLPTRDGLPAALNAVERSGVPLFWLRPAAPPVAGDLRIAGLRAPERILYGQPLHLTVELDSNGPANGQLSVSVDGRRLLQRPVTLAGGRPEQIPLRLGGLDSGTHRLRVTVDQADDPRPANNSRQATIQVDGPARVLYLDRGGPLPPLAASLRAGGWPLTHRTTEDFEPALLQRHDVLVLDDIAVSDLEEETWRGIGEAVRARGKGLLVLGGPHAFGGGGYRHSRLEALLPVTAEANQPLDPAAVLFLLDKSGSMEQREGVSGPSRLAVARQAIRETAALLEPGDLSGLITFDREAEQRLPLAPRKQPAAAIDRAGSFTPHGGTRLAPALRMAVEELAASAPKQRIILLVSDGFVEESGAFDTIAGDMARAGIDLIALAIGPTPDEGVLRRLTRINRGRLIRLQGILRLPRLMQQALQRHRAAIREGPLKPRLLHRPGFMALPDDWPPLQAGMVTRARPGAETWLVSQQGDPLLAGWFAGSGRVLTLPAGLGDWATAWQRWPAWGELAGGLIEEAAATRRDPMISIQRSDRGDRTRLWIDRVSADLEWSRDPLSLLLIDPAGRERPLRPQRRAPGRFLVEVATPLSGVYELLIRRDDQLSRYRFYREPVDELESLSREPTTLEAALTAGRIQPWLGAASLAAVPPVATGDRTRLPLLIMALGVYLFTLAAERALFPWRPDTMRRAHAGPSPPGGDAS